MPQKVTFSLKDIDAHASKPIVFSASDIDSAQPDKDGFVPLGSVSPEVDARLRAGMSQDDWNAMTPGERARELLKWGGHALGAMTSMGPDPTDHPVATLAGAAVPMAAGKAIAAMPAVTAPARKFVVSTAEDLYKLGVNKTIGKLVFKMLKSEPDVAKGMSQAGGRLVPKVAQPSLEDELVSAMRPDAPTSVTLPPHVPTPATKTTTRVYEAPRPAPSPVAAPPPAAPAVTPPAPATAPAAASKALSPQRLANELGLAAKRANADFNADQYAAAEALVGQGLTPVQAVMKIKEAGRSVNAAAELAKRLQNVASKSPPYESEVVHVTTADNAKAIAKEGFKTRGTKGLGGDDYGPGVYLADKASDAGSFWRSQIEFMNESGRVKTATMSGKVSLQKPLIVEDVKPIGGGHNGPKGAAHLVSEYLSDLKSEFEALVSSGTKPNAALGKIAKDAGYDGIVFKRMGGDEIVAFSPSSVQFAEPGNAAAELAKMLGTPTDEAMQAQIAARQYKQ